MTAIKLTPRQHRALKAMLIGPILREQLDMVAGCSNSPQLVADLSAKGFDINCELVRSFDRDGRTCWPGRYSLTAKGRALARRNVRD